MSKMTSWHVGVAAEAFTAGQFARYAYDVSVQYGANQPEYDLIAVSGDKMLKISVFYDLFDTCFDLIFVSRISVRHIPSRAYIHLVNIAHID